MALYSAQVFKWFTSPDELRRLADDLEARCKTVHPGASTKVSSITSPDGGATLEVHMDQDRCTKEGYRT